VNWTACLQLLLDAYLQLKPSWLVCAPNVLFIAFVPNYSLIQAFKRQVAKIERAAARSTFEQAPEPREPGERAG